MKSILLAPTLLFAAGQLLAQQPAAPAAAPKIPVRLDAIVAVVGDQAITRYDLSEANLDEDPATTRSRSRRTARPTRRSIHSCSTT